jgi:hypothetical protein
LLNSVQPRQTGWFGYLSVCAIGLSLVLTWLGPRSSEGLGTLNTLAFWFSHVSIGLAVLAAAQLMLGRISQISKLPPMLQVLIGGLIGAIMFVPAAFALDLLFQPPFASDTATGNALRDALTEFSQFVVPFGGLWLLLNAPTLVQLQQNQQGNAQSDSEIVDPAAAFWGKVPKALGRNLIALSAELHYLRVFTTQGDALILFSFGHAVELLDGPETCQIHRSHWVNLKYVNEVVTGNGAMTCVLSNALRLPVSRRHRKALKLGVPDNIDL